MMNTFEQDRLECDAFVSTITQQEITTTIGWKMIVNPNGISHSKWPKIDEKPFWPLSQGTDNISMRHI